MKKYIVLSVNDNPDYLYFVPLVCWAWEKFGWWPIVMFNGKDGDIVDYVFRKTFEEWDGTFVHRVDDIPGYRSDTITQVSRLFAANTVDGGGYLMTGDIDMLPLSDYWNPDFNKMTVWGHDLTGFGHYPICYIGMQTMHWRQVMKIAGHQWDGWIHEALDSLPQAKDPDFYKYWFTDQDLITQRLKPYNPVIINRGQYSNGYARGRVDRGAWTLDHDEYIDAHLFHQLYFKQNEDKFEKTIELLKTVWPDEDFGWYYNYHREYQRLTGHA